VVEVEAAVVVSEDEVVLRDEETNMLLDSSTVLESPSVAINPKKRFCYEFLESLPRFLKVRPQAG